MEQELIAVLLDLISKAIRAVADFPATEDFRIGWQACLIFLAAIGGLNMRELQSVFVPDIQNQLVGHAAMLIVKREDVWKAYTAAIVEHGPDDPNTRQLHAEYEDVNSACMRFVAAHPAEWAVAMSILGR